MSSTTDEDDSSTTQTPVLLLDDVLKGNSTTATKVVDMLMEVRALHRWNSTLKKCYRQIHHILFGLNCH